MINNMRATFSFIIGLLVLTLVVRAQEALTPGVDYPNYLSFPKTSFSCSEQKYNPGFYADVETKCQGFHYCFENRQEAFLCPVGTTFNQAILTCDSWYSSNCSLAPQFYSVNSEKILERAKRDVPMLMKLRNRAQNRSMRTPAANVYDKIASLYERNADQLDENAESIPETNNDLKPEMSIKSPQRDVSSQQRFIFDIPPRFEASIQNDQQMEEDVYYRGAFEEDEEVETVLYDPVTEEYLDESSRNEWQQQDDDEELETVLYDPVTEEYYFHDSPRNKWQQDPEDPTGQLGSFYNYENFAKKYGQALQDYIESSSEFPEGLAQSFNEEADVKGLFSRRMNTKQNSKRVRRKPIYTVVKDGDESEIPGGERRPRSSGRDSEDGTEAVSTDTEVTSEPPAESSTEHAETEERPRIPDGVSIHMRIPSFTYLNTSEAPLTSLDFEDAILNKLVLPRIDELDLKLLAREQDQRNEQSSTDFQADDRFAYVEDVTPEEYEAYSSEYNRDGIVIVGRPESDMEAHSSEEQIEWYRSRKTAVEDSAGTFVVIPDESDGVLDRYAEANGGDDYVDSDYYGMGGDEAEPESDYDSYDEFSHFQYESPEDYAKVYPSPFQVAELKYGSEFQKRFTPEGYLSPELLDSPYAFVDQSYIADDSSINGREFPGFRFAAEEPAVRYFPPDESGSYAYDRKTDSDYYTYDMQEVYPYVFGDPSLQIWRQAGYMPPKGSSEFEAFYGLSDSPFTARRQYYSDSSIPHWIQRDSSKSSEMENKQIEVADGPLQTEEFIGNLYRDAARRTDKDLDEGSFPEETKVEPFSAIENTKQAGTHDVIDFKDGESKTEVKLPASVETLVSGNEKVDSKESIQVVKPSLPNESSEDVLSNINVVGKFSTETNKDDLLAEAQSASESVNMKSPGIPDNVESTINAKSAVRDTWPFQKTESSAINEKPVTLSSALERLAGRRSPRMADARNVYTSDKFPNSMALPKSRDFGPYGVAAKMGQQYGVDSMTSSKANDGFSHRTGNTDQLNNSKLSALQERIRSIKQGKFGAFKKHASSAGNE